MEELDSALEASLGMLTLYRVRVLRVLITIQLNLFRCFILPIAYGVFLAVAQEFFDKPNNVSFRLLS